MRALRRSPALIAILVLAALLRVWGLTFGLPHDLTRPDEETAKLLAVRIFGRTLDPIFFDWPALFIYALAVLFVAYFNVGRLAGLFTSEPSFVRAAFANPAPLHLIARGLSAVAGVLTVASVHRAGTLLFGGPTGLIAGLYLAVAALHVRDSHFGMTDVSATFLMMQSFVFTVRLTREHSTRHRLLSALFAGLAASTRYNCGLIALAGLWAIATEGPTGLDRWPSRVKAAVMYGLVAAVAFVVGTPYALIHLPEFLTALERISAHLRDGHAAVAGYGWEVHLTSSLRYGLGLPLLVAGIAGFALHLRRDWRDGVLLLLFPAVYYVLIGSGRTTFARYILPVVPFLCIAGAHTTLWLSSWFTTRLRRPAFTQQLAWLLTLAVAAPSAWSAVRSDILLARTDNRLLAATWIGSRFDAGGRVYQSGASYVQVQMQTADRSRADRYIRVELDDTTGTFVDAERQPTNPPDFAVVPDCPLIYCNVPEPLRRILARDYRLERTFVAHEPDRPGLVYDMDDAFFVPLAGFDAVTRPGPNLSIYVRRSESR